LGGGGWGGPVDGPVAGGGLRGMGGAVPRRIKLGIPKEVVETSPPTEPRRFSRRSHPSAEVQLMGK
jgi:hypothetical protein